MGTPNLVRTLRVVKLLKIVEALGVVRGLECPSAWGLRRDLRVGEGVGE